jgi:hypothetical protein
MHDRMLVARLKLPLLLLIGQHTPLDARRPSNFLLPAPFSQNFGIHKGSLLEYIPRVLMYSKRSSKALILTMSLLTKL